MFHCCAQTIIRIAFAMSGATLCNNLPRDVRQAESLGLFKRLIKEVRRGKAFVESSFSQVSYDK